MIPDSAEERSRLRFKSNNQISQPSSKNIHETSNAMPQLVSQSKHSSMERNIDLLVKQSEVSMKSPRTLDQSV